MSWCCCCKPEDEAIQSWKADTKYIIKIVEKIRHLGKKCILNRQVNREDPIDVRDIVKCFKILDKRVHNIKLEAVQFLAPNFELLRQRSCQISHYKENTDKRFKALHKEIQVLKEEYSETNEAIEENLEPCTSQTHCNKFQELNESIENIPQVQLSARRVFLKQDKLLSDLKNLLSKFDESINILKFEIDNLESEIQKQHDDGTDEEYNYSDEEIQVNAVAYSVRRNYSPENNDDLGSQVYSSNETVTFLKKEILEQGWPLFQDCIRCVWGNYCTSSQQETYSSARNRSRSVQREMEDEDTTDQPKTKNRSTRRSQLNIKKQASKENKKIPKRAKSKRPKPSKADDEENDKNVEKKKQGNKKGGAKKSKNVNKKKSSK